MAYSEIADTAIDADSPITTGLMTKLRDNPLFIGDQQTFTSSGTWTKPTETNRGQYAYVQVWGAGGGGAGYSGWSTGGGGGGSYRDRVFLLSALSATETITIGAGGAGGGLSANGTNGGSSSFGSYMTAYGGTGGQYTAGAGAVGGAAGGV